MPTKVKGLDRLLKQLQSLPELQVTAAAQSIEQGAQQVAAAIARAAPKRTGEMSAGIKAVPVPDDAKGSAGVKGGAGLSWKIVAPFPGRFVEFGTKGAPSGRYRDAKGKTRKNKRAHHATKAEPFFWPTVRAFRKRVRSRIGRNANKAAKAAAKVT